MQFAYVVYEAFTALDLLGPLEVLSRIPGTSHTLVAARRGPHTADNGALRVVVDTTLDELTDPDVIIVPGGTAGARAAAEDPALLGWLRRTSRDADWTTSVCTGSLILGAAGLLTGRRATTHWVALHELAEHGATPVAQRVVIDGDVLTAAGVSAGIDMALELTAVLRGRQLGKLIQLAIEYDPAPPFDSGSPVKAGHTLTWAARTALRREFSRPLPPAPVPDGRAS